MSLALLQYQRENRDKLLHQLQASEQQLTQLKQSVVELDHKLRQQHRTTAITATDVQTLRDENQRLRVEIQLMTRQIEAVNVDCKSCILTNSSMRICFYYVPLNVD